MHTYTHIHSHRGRRGKWIKDGILGDVIATIILNCDKTEKYLGLWLITFVLYCNEKK